MDDEVPILGEENYSTWRIEMRVYLKTMGVAIWKATIGGYFPLKNKSKFAAQREGKKNEALALKMIKIWTRGQILAQKLMFSELPQIRREDSPRRHEPNAICFVSNRCRERKI
jgi:hypothetical protein